MKKKLLFIVVSLIFLLVLGNLGAAQAWYDPAQSYRVPIEINNSCGEAVTDYQVKINLTSSSFNFSEAKVDGSDVRITAGDGSAPIPFWIETWNHPTDATIWAKVSELSDTESTTIYIYYGNPSTSSQSDGSETFVFFDSFEDFNTSGMNAPNFLTTPTYDGFGQVVHPDIVYVQACKV